MHHPSASANCCTAGVGPLIVVSTAQRVPEQPFAFNSQSTAVVSRAAHSKAPPPQGRGPMAGISRNGRPLKRTPDAPPLARAIADPPVIRDRAHILQFTWAEHICPFAARNMDVKPTEIQHTCFRALTTFANTGKHACTTAFYLTYTIASTNPVLMIILLPLRRPWRLPLR